MFIVLEIEIITQMLSQKYDSNSSRQLLNSFKTLTINSESRTFVRVFFCRTYSLLYVNVCVQTMYFVQVINNMFCLSVWFYFKKLCSRVDTFAADDHDDQFLVFPTMFQTLFSKYPFICTYFPFFLKLLLRCFQGGCSKGFQ